jgi:hypothetical protein
VHHFRARMAAGCARSVGVRHRCCSGAHGRRDCIRGGLVVLRELPCTKARGFGTRSGRRRRRMSARSGFVGD